MHLKQLKLAGFKSFVDPTVVHFPSQLVAVLGPNGCGKSNIIDAVRWVMGESSAKNLRGESMIDVIFNGSTHRKPLGQASVELVFDNSMGRLTGPLASYREISLKRVVTRDGDSSYYLNGSRCRRRDITEIFLGTGAGARGYSIIGQGTISRLIEAKPEELRAYLEEAAGVSKYKERRRETLQRIEHTRENLTRIADIREELDKQLQRLERQAKAAERYTVLKEEERLCRADILALKWQDFNKQRLVKQRELYELALRYERLNSLLTGANSERISLNETLQDENDKCQEIQVIFYQLGTEIARLEETIQQREREKKRLENDRQQMQDDWQEAQNQLMHDNEDLNSRQHRLLMLDDNLKQLKEDFKTNELLFKETQYQKIEWESRWQEVQNSSNTNKRELQVAQVKLNHLEQRRQQSCLRLEKLTLDRSSISLSDLRQNRLELEEQQIKLQETQAFDLTQFQDHSETVGQLRIQLKDIEQQLHQYQDNFLKVNSEYAALVAAQNASSFEDQSNQDAMGKWSEKPRLMSVLRVEPEWQTVCEMVLHDALKAHVLEEFELVFSEELCQRSGASAVTLREAQKSTNSYPSLANQIQGKIPFFAHPLESIFTADHLEEALTWLPNIQDNESIVLASGVWFGKGWVRCVKSHETDEIGLLARQQQIDNLAVHVNELKLSIEEVRALRDANHAKLQDQLNYSEIFQLNLNASNEALRVNHNALVGNEQALLNAQNALERIASECEEIHLVLEEAEAERMSLIQQIELLNIQSNELVSLQEQYSQDKLMWIDTLASSQHALDNARSILHQSELEYDREVTKIQQLMEKIVREKDRLFVLQERLEHLAQRCIQSMEPESEFKQQLHDQLLRHEELEVALAVNREQLSGTRLTLDAIEKQIINYDLDVKRLQEVIGQARLDEQALAVRESSVLESLDELGLQIQTLLDHIPEGITQSTREEDLIALSEKIKRLGAINLAAIEEYASEQQRKMYLDEQYGDLSQALTALETAIEKMDKETRLRLENTFDEVNNSFKSLFPRLFGGGRAHLELTCDNLLEAGIVVMAQPPGKRNSTIHLLSGGEKAMTAVALVFAIFQLNPSPFCMLDEVDAPLDDVNVGRFCDLVKDMSQFVQFLFITHNKVTMELADHLIGVTMREPGVSRLVAVDVKHALTME